MATPATAVTNPTAAPARRAAAQRALPVVTPRVDIYETESAYVVLADMPGVKADGVDVVAERNELSLRGRVEPPATDCDYQEFEPANYERTFVLTDDLETSKVSATLRDGVLRIDIPKSERVQPKKIPVKVE